MTRLIGSVVLLGGLIAGCAGSARIGVVPLDLKKLRDSDPLIRNLDAPRCYHWQDERGRLCIATQDDKPSLFGDYGRHTIVMSLVLDEPPAGQARDYHADQDTLRMIARAGAEHVRWASLAGIVAVQCTPDGQVRARFRLAAKQQKFHIALGWSSNSRVLLFGELDAVPNPERGRKILTRTEANGMDRTDR